MKNRIVNGIIKNLTSQWWSTHDENIFIYRFTKKFTEFCCDNLPKPIRKKVFTIMDFTGIILSRFFFLLSQLPLTIYLLKGEEKYSKKNISVLLLSNKKSFPYLSNKIFLKTPKVEVIGKTHLWRLNKKIDAIISEVDAVFIKNDLFYSRFLKKKGFTIIPERISMALDVSQPIGKIYNNFNKSGKEDVRKVKKYGYTYEISEDVDKLDLFYYKMYLPYTYQRHGNTAICANYYTIRHLFERGSKLMLIKQNDEYVYGSLFSVKKDKVIATYAGLMEGKDDYLKKGISAAAYYFLIKWSKENGIKFADFGTCRSFLNNGVFCYKRKWGTTIKKADSKRSPEIFAFKLLSNSISIVSFLNNNPFIFLDDSQLKISVFDEKSLLDSEEFQHFLENNNTLRLSELANTAPK